MDRNETCKVCGKQLQSVDCLACHGTGYQRKLGVFKTDCEVCSGTGKVLRCPDEYRHTLKEPAFPDLITGPGLKLPKSKLPKLTGTTLFNQPKPNERHVRPPWNPSNQNLWRPRDLNRPNNPNLPARPPNWNPMNPRGWANRNGPFNPKPGYPGNPMDLRRPEPPQGPGGAADRNKPKT